MPRLPPTPELDWTAEGAPSARVFGDAYFSRQGGLAESEAVFLAGCGLPRAWKGRRRFVIGELGFGTGLNVLATWRAWRATREPHAILHMCSVEAFPLAAHDAARALAAFSEIGSLADQLLAHWPVRAYGPQRLWFPEDGFALTVHIGAASTWLEGISGAFDAWYLDGFAPDRNPGMWTPALFARLAALSAPGARAASFTVAGAVRRGLEAAGFRIEKKPGFGAKRERLEARLDAAAPVRHPLYPRGGTPPNRVAILGAGIAGAAAAHALARHGAETIVLDAAPSLGAGASGNPAGLIAPRLDRDASGVSEMFLAAYLDAVRAYSALGGEVFNACGLVERPGPRDADVIAGLLDDPPLPPDWIARDGENAAFYRQAGVVKPLEAIGAFLRHATLMLEAPVAAIEPAGEGWRLFAPDGKLWLKADAVVLACGAALRAFEPARFLPLHFSRGQIEWGALGGEPMAHAELGACFAAPFGSGLMFGATFDRADPDAPVFADAPSRQRNLAALARLDPDLASRVNAEALASRAALRVSTPDRAPIVGQMPDAPAWLAQNGAIAQGRPHDDTRPAPALAGVHVLGALGARGFTLAPLLGEILASDMMNAPQTLSKRALDAIHPARFLHRSLKKSGKVRGNGDGV